MTAKNINFYSELVIATVLSIVAANAWTILLSTSLNKFFPGSLTVDLLTAVIITIVAVTVLFFVFSKEQSPFAEKVKKENMKKPRHFVYSDF